MVGTSTGAAGTDDSWNMRDKVCIVTGATNGK